MIISYLEPFDIGLNPPAHRSPIRLSRSTTLPRRVGVPIPAEISQVLAAWSSHVLADFGIFFIGVAWCCKRFMTCHRKNRWELLRNGAVATGVSSACCIDMARSDLWVQCRRTRFCVESQLRAVIPGYLRDLKGRSKGTHGVHVGVLAPNLSSGFLQVTEN